MVRTTHTRQQLFALGAKDKRATSWVRRNYFGHRSVANAIDLRLSQDGAPLSYRARQLWNGRCLAREVSLASMKDQEDRKVLEARNEWKFGGRVVPEFEWLREVAEKRGLDQDGQFESIIHWALRPDLYEYKWQESQGFSHLRKLKPETRKRTKADGQRLKRQVEWTKTGDPEVPFIAKSGCTTWTVRVNEFPEEPLYSLLENGVEVMDFDDWPRLWSRPSG